MSIDKFWAPTEIALRREANSLGELLERLRGRVSSVLIGDRAWGKLIERARELPVTIAAFPFGFEVPLHELRPEADFGVSLVGGSLSAAYFERAGRSEDAKAPPTGIAWLLEETEQGESALRQAVGRKMLLEYDVDPTPQGTSPDPGIFLYPAGDTLVGDRSSQRLRDLGVVADAVVRASCWDSDTSERRQIDQVYLALDPDTRVGSVGAFPSRRRGVRLAMTGFRKARDVMAFLERAGWSGNHSHTRSIISQLEERGSFAHMGVHFDVQATGVGPTLGLSFFAREAEWLKDVRHWIPLIDGLREQRLAVPEKLAALADSSSGAEMLFGKSSPFLLLRGIHHIKLVLKGDCVEQVKAYLFLLMLSPPPQIGSSSEWFRAGLGADS